ncbi:MAG: UpxY family transcription antiterminator [Acidobacteria bacterium]|nr:UpxY family transcription antiterminator [Acidobacteriota bacterium]
MDISEPNPNTSSWYALYVRNRHEKLVSDGLGYKGYEVFLPMYKSRRRWSDRVKDVECPVFPSYVFCRFDAQQRLPILTTPGVLHVVGTTSSLLPVDEAELEAVRAVLRSGLPLDAWPFLAVGQSVYLETGPLAGMEGIVVDTKKQYRLVVSVSLLQRSLAVEIDRTWVRPTSPRRPSQRIQAPTNRAPRLSSSVC